MNWTDEELHVLVSSRISIAEFLRKKELPDKCRHFIKKDLNRLGYSNINLHKNVKRKNGVFWSREIIEEAMKTSHSLAECIRKITGKPDKNSNDWRRLQRLISEYNIDTSNLPKLHLRTSIGTKKYKTINKNEQIFVIDTKFTHATVRDRYMAINFPDKCSICAIKEWNGSPIVLQLDHINGNNKDCRFTNLRWLCPNCHSQTDTYMRGLKAKINWPSNEELIDMSATMNCYEMGRIINTHPAYVAKKLRVARITTALVGRFQNQTPTADCGIHTHYQQFDN